MEALEAVYSKVKQLTNDNHYVVLNIIKSELPPYIVSVEIYSDTELNEILHVLETDSLDDVGKKTVQIRTKIKQNYKHVKDVITVPHGDNPIDFLRDKKSDQLDELDSLLDGFSFPAAKGMPEIYIGKRNRLYLRGPFERTFDIQPQSRVLIGYRPKDDCIAVIRPEALRKNREAQAAGYFVSKRYDVTAAGLFTHYDLQKQEGAVYYFDRASSDSSIAIFRQY